VLRTKRVHLLDLNRHTSYSKLHLNLWTFKCLPKYLGNWKMEEQGFKSSHSILAQKLGFLWFWKHRDSFCSLNDSLWSLKFCNWFLTKAYFESLPSFDHPTSKSLYGALSRDENFEAHLPCICCKVKFWTSPERNVILLDQNCASVWNFGGNILLCFLIWSLAFYFETWLAFSLCAHHFFNAFRTFMCPYFFLYFGTFMCPILSFFCIAFLSLSRNMLVRSYSRAWSIYMLEMETCF
jgi:hypothetical protein